MSHLSVNRTHGHTDYMLLCAKNVKDITFILSYDIQFRLQKQVKYDFFRCVAVVSVESGAGKGQSWDFKNRFLCKGELCAKESCIVCLHNT